MDSVILFSGMTIHLYGLYIAAAALLTLGAMGVLGYLNRLPPGTVRVFGLIGMPLGLLFSRAAFCVINSSVYLETFQNPWLMLRVFDGGLSMSGLLCGLVLAAFLAAHAMKARFGKLLDVLCVAMGLMMALVRMGERCTDLGIGKIVNEGWLTQNFPWLFIQSRMGIITEYRMTVFLYEAILNFLIFSVLLLLFLRRRDRIRVGDLSLLFFALYGSGQILMESLRDDGHMLMIFLRVEQLCAAMLPVIVTVILTARYVHLNGRPGLRMPLTWLGELTAVGGLVFLEFSLDGRITWGTPSMLRDYILMFAFCALLFTMPCSLLVTLNKRLYRSERFRVTISS